MSLLDAIFSSRVALAGVEAITRKLINFSAVFTVEDDATNGRTNIGLAALTSAELADHSVTNAKLRQSAARSVIGRANGSAGDVDDITANIDDRILARTGGVLGFVQLAIGMIPNGLITLAKLANDALAIGYVTSAGTAITLASATHRFKTLVCSSNSSIAITVPSQSGGSADDFGEGAVVEIIPTGTGQITVAGDGFTVRSEGGKLKSSGQYTSIFLKKLPGTNEWQATGGLTV